MNIYEPPNSSFDTLNNVMILSTWWCHFLVNGHKVVGEREEGEGEERDGNFLN